MINKFSFTIFHCQGFLVHVDDQDQQRRTDTIQPGGGGVLFGQKNYTVPECLIVEIRFLLTQNVREKHSFTILKSHRTVRIRNKEFLEPHINFMQNKLLPLN